jgi:phage terminase large subunit
LTTLKIKTPRWALPFMKPSRYKGAWGGRGSGKSHFFAELMVEAHVMDPDCFSVCVREVQRSLAQSVKRLIEQKIEHLGVGHYFEIQHDCIKSKKGKGIIIFQGLATQTAESIKSFEGFRYCWVEEAQVLSQRSLDMLRPTIRADESEIWFSWNPRNESDPVDQLLRGDNPPPSAIVREVNYSDNPFFPDVLREEMEYDKGRDGAKYKHVWLGQYLSKTEASVFHNWAEEDFDDPPKHEHPVFRFGADFGYANDPTVLIRLFVEGRKLFITHEAWKIGCEIVNTPDLFLTVPDSERYPIMADSARPETISHLQKHGFPKCLPALKGKGSVEDGIEWLKSYDIVVHPRCTHTIDELKNYRWKTDPITDQILQTPEDKNNHVIDALRYACEGARRIKPRSFKPIDYAKRGLNAGIV